MGIFNKKQTGNDDHASAIRDFKKIKTGDALPRDGACKSFYELLTYAGQTLALSDGKTYHFFHVENDDVVQEILAGTPSWQVFSHEGRTTVAILFKTGASINRVQLTIDLNMSESARILTFLRKKRGIEIYLLNMIYGSIVRERTLTVPMPKQIAEEIKKAVG